MKYQPPIPATVVSAILERKLLEVGSRGLCSSELIEDPETIEKICKGFNSHNEDAIKYHARRGIKWGNSPGVPNVYSQRKDGTWKYPRWFKCGTRKSEISGRREPVWVHASCISINQMRVVCRLNKGIPSDRPRFNPWCAAYEAMILSGIPDYIGHDDDGGFKLLWAHYQNEKDLPELPQFQNVV